MVLEFACVQSQDHSFDLFLIFHRQLCPSEHGTARFEGRTQLSQFFPFRVHADPDLETVGLRGPLVLVLAVAGPGIHEGRKHLAELVHVGPLDRIGLLHLPLALLCDGECQAGVGVVDRIVRVALLCLGHAGGDEDDDGDDKRNLGLHTENFLLLNSYCMTHPTLKRG